MKLVMPAGLSVAVLMISSAFLPPAALASAPRVDPAQLLGGIRTIAESPRVGYDRELFEHWDDVDGDGCDTRQEVLIAEAITKPSVTAGCYLNGGRWRSIYDGLVTRDPSEFDVDHVVALAEAWDSGASKWDDATRKAFANDLSSSFSLVAVSASSNRSKSDNDVTDWLPKSSQSACWLATATVVTKYRWRLSIDSPEKKRLATLLSRCPKITIQRVSRAKVTLATTLPATKPAPESPDSHPKLPAPPLGDSSGLLPIESTCPALHPVKGNVTRTDKIYHEPTSQYYELTKPEYCFPDALAAIRAGFRAPR